MLGKGTRDETPPIDFNDCVSKNELQKLIRGEHTFIDEKLNQVMQSINTLAKWIEDFEQQRLEQHRDDIDDDDLKDEDVGNGKVDTEARRTFAWETTT